MTKITPGLTDNQVLAATAAITLVPTVALVLLWADFPRLGGVLLFLPLAVGLGSEAMSILCPRPAQCFLCRGNAMGAAVPSDSSSTSRSGSVGMLDCHPGIQRCAVFKSGGQAVDQMRNGAEKSNAFLHGPNRLVPKIDCLSGHAKENPQTTHSCGDLLVTRSKAIEAPNDCITTPAP